MGWFYIDEFDTWSATVDYGDGSGIQPLLLEGPIGASSFALSHRYTSTGTYTIEVEVTDDDGVTDVATLSAEVSDRSPFLKSLSGTVIALGEIYEESGRVWAYCPEDVVSLSVDYGDGTGQTPLSAVDGVFELSHEFGQVGDYEVVLSVADDDGAMDQESCVVRVLHAIPPLPEIVCTSHTEDELSTVRGVDLAVLSPPYETIESYEIRAFKIPSDGSPRELHDVFERARDWVGETFMPPIQDELGYTVGVCAFEVAAIDHEGDRSAVASFGPYPIDTRRPSVVSFDPPDGCQASFPVVFRGTFDEPVVGLNPANCCTFPFSDNFFVAEILPVNPMTFDFVIDSTNPESHIWGQYVHVVLDPQEGTDLAGNAIRRPYWTTFIPAHSNDQAVAYVDTVTPKEPLWSSVSHKLGVPRNAQVVSWELDNTWGRDPNANENYAIGFKVRLDQSSTCTFAGVPTHLGYPGEGQIAVPCDGEWWLHAVAIDCAGNVSEPSHYGPILVDTTAPEVSLSSEHEEWSHAPIIFQVESDEAIRLRDTGAIAADGGDLIQITSSHVTVNPTREGEITLSLGEGAMKDLAGNLAGAANRSVEYTDGVPPAAPTAESTTHEIGVASNDGAVSLTVATTDVGLGVAGFESAWDQSDAWSASHTQAHDDEWNGGVFEATVDGEWWFHVAAVDKSGNWSEEVHLGPFVIDTKAPSVEITAERAETDMLPLVFSIAFDEAVMGFDSDGIEITNGVVDSLQELPTGAFELTVDPDDEGEVKVSVPAGAALDLAGNGNVASGPAVTLYNVLPALCDVSIWVVDPSDPPNPFVPPREYCTIGDTVRLAFTSSEKLESNPSVDIGPFKNLEASNQGGRTYLLELVADDSFDEGEIEFEIEFEDTQENVETVDATTDDTSVIFDNEPPAFDSCPGDMTIDDDRASWREPTAWDAGSGVVSLTKSHDQETCSFPVGTTNVRYEATDRVGHVAICEFDVTRVDEAPTAVIDLASGQDDPTSDAVINLVAVFSENVWGAYDPPSSDCCDWCPGCGEFEVEVDGTAGPATACANIISQMTEFSIRVCGMTQSGVVRVRIPAGAVKDAENPPNVNAATDWFEVEYEYVPPPPPPPPVTVTVDKTSSQEDPTAADKIYFEAIFSEPVPDFEPDDVVLGGTAGATTVEIYTRGGTDEWVLHVSGMTQEGTVTASIPAGACHSGSTGAENEASTSDDNEVEYDPSIPPTVEIYHFGDDPTSDVPIEFMAVFSIDVYGLEADEIILGGTAGATTVFFEDPDPVSSYWNIRVTGMTQAGTVTVLIPANVCLSDAGDTPNEASNECTVNYDPTP